MGIDIGFRTERIEIINEYCEVKDYVNVSPSRGFCNFVCGFDAFGENCELNQIQKLLDIDLRALLLTNYSDIQSEVESYNDYIEWQLSEAKTEEERREIEEEAKIVRQRITENEEIQNKQWNYIDEFEKLIIDFKSKLLINNDLAQNLKFYYLDEDYFSLQNIKRTLLCDLDIILQFIAFAKSKGEQKFAFYFM